MEICPSAANHQTVISTEAAHKSHREPRSGEIRFPTQTASPPPLRLAVVVVLGFGNLTNQVLPDPQQITSSLT
jgi:hypothetical protein